MARLLQSKRFESDPVVAARHGTFCSPKNRSIAAKDSSCTVFPFERERNLNDALRFREKTDYLRVSFHLFPNFLEGLREGIKGRIAWL